MKTTLITLAFLAASCGTATDLPIDTAGTAHFLKEENL